MSKAIELLIDFNYAIGVLECRARRGDFTMRVDYSNVKADSLDPRDLSPYIEDFLQEFEKALNKHIEVYCEV